MNDVFSRQRLAGYDPERLRGASVLVAGAGSLAQPVAEALVLSGVGDLRIVDLDRFEPHNRAKSSHYPHQLRDADGDALPHKAEWVAQSLAAQATAPGAAVRYANAWVEDLGADAFAAADVVVSCVDAIPARRYVARKALELDRPLVTGGFRAHALWFEVYPAAEQPRARSCWNCGRVPDTDVFSCRHYAAEAEREAIIPAIQTGATALGGYMAEAAIMALHGREPVARSVSLDLRTGESLLSRLVPDPDCAARHRVLEIDVIVPTHPDRGSAAALAAALGEPDAVVALDAPFVLTAACRSCERTAAVDAPLWAWVAQPRCHSEGCGGRWPLTGDAGRRLPPEAPAQLRPGDELWTRPLAELGVAPGDLLHVAVPGRDLVVKLAGSADERCPRAMPR